MGSQPEVMHLPATRRRAPLAAYQLGASSTPEEARRFVAVVSDERTVMAALKCERRRFFSSDFIAKVVNDSDDELACSVTGWTHRGSVSLEPGYFWIKAQSVAQIPIHAPLRLPHRLRTIALNMHNAHLRASAEADVPAPPALRFGAGFIALAGLVLVALLGWHAATPAISAYTLPAQVAAGDRIVASYAFTGAGTGEYDVVSGGEHVAGGVLSTRQGSFSFPTSKSAGTYHVTFSVVGPFGTARRELLSQAIPFRTADALSIGALQPDPSVVHSGETIDVRYVADGARGTVTLFDASDIALQRVAYNSNGLSMLVAPDVDVPTQYRVELDVTRGSDSAHASAGLLVTPKDGATVAPPPGPKNAQQLFSVEPVVASASTFAVRLLQHPDALRLTLEDASGTAIESQPIAETEQLAYFQAPNVSEDTSYVIVASFSTGDADQVLLQHVLVRVR